MENPQKKVKYDDVDWSALPQNVVYRISQFLGKTSISSFAMHFVCRNWYISLGEIYKPSFWEYKSYVISINTSFIKWFMESNWIDPYDLLLSVLMAKKDITVIKRVFDCGNLERNQKYPVLFETVDATSKEMVDGMDKVIRTIENNGHKQLKEKINAIVAKCKPETTHMDKVRLIKEIYDMHSAFVPICFFDEAKCRILGKEYDSWTKIDDGDKIQIFYNMVFGGDLDIIKYICSQINFGIADIPYKALELLPKKGVKVIKFLVEKYNLRYMLANYVDASVANFYQQIFEKYSLQEFIEVDNLLFMDQILKTPSFKVLIKHRRIDIINYLFDVKKICHGTQWYIQDLSFPEDAVLIKTIVERGGIKRTDKEICTAIFIKILKQANIDKDYQYMQWFHEKRLLITDACVTFLCENFTELLRRRHILRQNQN